MASRTENHNQDYAHVTQNTEGDHNEAIYKTTENADHGEEEQDVVHHMDQKHEEDHHEAGSSGYEEDEENDALNVSYYAREYSGRWFCFPRTPKSSEHIFVLPIEEESKKYTTKQYNKEWYGPFLDLAEAKAIARDATEINKKSIENLVGRSWLYQAVPEFFIGVTLGAIIIFIVGEVENLELVIPVTIAITAVILLVYFYAIRKYSTSLFQHSEARLSQYFSQINANVGSQSVWVIGEYGMWLEFHAIEDGDLPQNLELPEGDPEVGSKDVHLEVEGGRQVQRDIVTLFPE